MRAATVLAALCALLAVGTASPVVVSPGKQKPRLAPTSQPHVPGHREPSRYVPAPDEELFTIRAASFAVRAISVSGDQGSLRSEGSDSSRRDTWLALAECESGVDWTANTGNGFYGGLQFNLESWEWAGGLEFAPRPDLATADQQIAVAEKLLSIHPRGWGAWPACANKLGLW